MYGIRYSEINGEPEETRLKAGLDFRLPRYRREVFLRFYEFHLRYRAHPGCVYYTLPAVAEAAGYEFAHQAYWPAFVNGHTQNPVTTLKILRRFPRLNDTRGGRLETWWGRHAATLPYDTDRRYHRKHFPAAVEAYRRAVSAAGNEHNFALEVLGTGKFADAWRAARALPTFGRLSAFSYLEYMKIVGTPVECDTLFLTDLEGSRSHRNGLLKVLGRDDLDWHRSNGGFDGKYDYDTLCILAAEGATLLAEARERVPGRDTGYFTLESALCTFKSWFRKNRRYPNVYNDMLHDRIKLAEARFPEDDYTALWGARRRELPERLRLEDNPGDPGCVPLKQNWFRNTGQVIMMDGDWPCFKNDFLKGER